MNAFVNSKTYEAGNVNYSTTGILDKFPSDLKNSIIDTTVVSGYGVRDNANTESTDKLYLLSAKEIYNLSDAGYDTSSVGNITRQLDYYDSQNVTTSSTSGAIKKLNQVNDSWWMRSPISYQQYNYGNYTYVYADGRNIANMCIYQYGVSPAFRLAN